MLFVKADVRSRYAKTMRTEADPLTYATMNLNIDFAIAVEATLLV